MRTTLIAPISSLLAISYFGVALFILDPLNDNAPEMVRSVFALSLFATMMAALAFGMVSFGELIQQWKVLGGLERLLLFVGFVVPVFGVLASWASVIHDLLNTNWGH